MLVIGYGSPALVRVIRTSQGYEYENRVFNAFLHFGFSSLTRLTVGSRGGACRLLIHSPSR